MNKTAIECWNIPKYEIESIFNTFSSLKKQGKRSRKKHMSKETITKIVFNQIMLKFIGVPERMKSMHITGT